MPGAATRPAAAPVTALLALLTGCVASPTGPAASVPPASALPAPSPPQSRLPASFAGTLPCQVSAGERAQLDLWPDGVFHLQRFCAGPPARDDDRGRWALTPESNGLRLHGGREMPLAFAWNGPDVLVPLDVNGRPQDAGHFELRRLAAFQPAPLSLGLHGMFRHLADAPSFEECLTGRGYPVAMEGDYLALERAYAASPVGGTGRPIMASFDGEITDRPAMEGDRQVPTVVVRRFVNLWPGGTCERAMSTASLAETYWKLVRLRGGPVVTAEHQREAHLILQARDGRYKGAFGCFRYTGGYRAGAPDIAFDPPQWTVEGDCAAAEATASDAPRSAYAGALADARRWRIDAQALELFDAGGASLALFEAVYLR